MRRSVWRTQWIGYRFPAAAPQVQKWVTSESPSRSATEPAGGFSRSKHSSTPVRRTAGSRAMYWKDSRSCPRTNGRSSWLMDARSATQWRGSTSAWARERSRLPEDAVHAQGDAWQTDRGQRLAALDGADVGVALTGRLPVAFDGVRRKIHQPRFRDSGMGVQRDFGPPVRLERGIAHFDDQQ